MPILPEFAERFLEEHERESIDLLLEYARIPAPYRGEEKRAAFIKEHLEKLGATDIIVDEENNVICPIGCTAESTGIHVVSAHMDTVYPDTTPLPVEIHEDGRMVGPGVGDNSSSAAALMRAHEVILRNHLQAKEPVIILYDSGEESPNDLRGMRHFIRTYGNRIKDVITIDGDFGHTFDAVMGIRVYKIRTQGAAVSPYVEADHFVNALDTMNMLMEKILGFQMPTEYKTAQCIRDLNGTSDSAEMVYWIRSRSYRCVMQVDAQLQKALAEVKETGKKIDWELEKFCEGDEEEINGALKERVEQAYQMVGLPKVAWNPSPGDILPPLMAKIPAVGIGAGRSGPGHRRDEWLDTAYVKTGTKLVTSLLLDYFNI